MDRVIIGIHGLKNKPPEKVLKDWWLLSIYDGLAAVGLPQIPFSFELLYWADLFYSKPLDVKITDDKDPLFISNPYKKIVPPLYSKISLRKLRSRERIERMEDQLFQNDYILHSFEDIADRLVKYIFNDLDGYLNNKTGLGDAQHRPARDIILERLGNLLYKYRNKRVMLIAHSMGSIITYDLLMQPDSSFKINTLITLGSPLGQPTLMDKFAPDNPVLTKIKTPEGIGKWINNADLDDMIALDPTLGDDYAANSQGVLPEDIFVDNRYTWEGSKNAHAIYGYLQTPAVARRIYDFIMKDRLKISQALLHAESWVYSKLFKLNDTRLKQSPTRPERQKNAQNKKSKTQEIEHQAST
jgi:hypothetical protein